ncbi:MAG: CDP-archaeol synthase [Treponema sp.]|nr:CDP-archaeol synthase [Treponema sp.]MDY5122709.1 CDP-archaeol synthase [Treponema sp.]
MSKLAQRLLVFFIGVPLVLGIVFVNFEFHLPFQIIVMAAAMLAANEMYNMLSKKHKLFSKALIMAFSGLLPFISYALILANLPLEFVQWVYLFEVLIFLVIGIFQKSFSGIVEKVAFSSFAVFYCGYLLTYLSRMTVVLAHSQFAIALFFILVFLCDSLAWLFGNLFGKNNKGIIPASPNKSIAGFIGGILGSVASGCLFKFIIEKLGYNDVLTGNYLKICILGFVVSLAAIIGDLVESVIKRNMEVKDSGKLIPGRGGMLDCMDSVVMAAPVFTIFLHLLYN